MTDQNLLDILQAHGQEFLASFSLPNASTESKKRKRAEPSASREQLDAVSSTSEDEWEGINEIDNLLDDSEDSNSEDDDQFTATSSGVDSKVIVFQDLQQKSNRPSSVKDMQMKSFMSSKISKLRQASPQAGKRRKKSEEEEEEEERTNAQNDAMLHRLVHTQLLSGSLNPELDMTPAQRRKALAGRVLELSGSAKLGKGEKSVRDKEHNKASKRVRDGLKEKQQERARQRLEQAKELGNYHPTLKNMFEDNEAPSSKKRERGLKMGVGKFRGGLLQLGQEDLRLVNGPHRTGPHMRNRGKGKGKGTGR
ncbi:hypothetical protein H0H93_007739 [Arthromyces matolae]|nr:hypothetical protein H0H93_007739 [Arthromyces matolae]